MAIAGLTAATAPPPLSSVSATVTGLRSDKGQVLACLTANAGAFPRCEKDPDARALAVPASGAVEFEFRDVPPGQYAIALIHDENANGRLDMRLMLPHEGFGFSRDARVRFGPPSFAKAAFSINGEARHQTIRMRYIF